MNQRPALFNVGNMIAATELSKMRRVAIEQAAHQVMFDPDKEARLAAQQCRTCFYGGKLGGAAITTRPCAACLVDQRYASTYTDALCLPCAATHNLCKHCMGDSETRTGRRKWPKVETP
jgi:hypothetical protein